MVTEKHRCNVSAGGADKWLDARRTACVRTACVPRPHAYPPARSGCSPSRSSLASATGSCVRRPLPRQEVTCPSLPLEPLLPLEAPGPAAGASTVEVHTPRDGGERRG